MTLKASWVILIHGQRWKLLFWWPKDGDVLTHRDISENIGRMTDEGMLANPSLEKCNYSENNLMVLTIVCFNQIFATNTILFYFMLLNIVGWVKKKKVKLVFPHWGFKSVINLGNLKCLFLQALGHVQRKMRHGSNFKEIPEWWGRWILNILG